jgi:hypothetical protein
VVRVYLAVFQEGGAVSFCGRQANDEPPQPRAAAEAQRRVQQKGLERAVSRSDPALLIGFDRAQFALDLVRDTVQIVSQQLEAFEGQEQSHDRGLG